MIVSGCARCVSGRLASGLAIGALVGLLGFSACVQAKPPTDTGDVGLSPGSPTSVTTTPAPGSSPAASPSPGASPTPTPTQGLAYNPDLQAIFAGDCVSCHTDRNAFGGYSMSSYQAVMRAVRPGDASSTLVRVCQSSGSMYRYFSGTRSTKAQKVYDWVVKYGAAERR
jgi:hypothetical protein